MQLNGLILVQVKLLLIALLPMIAELIAHVGQLPVPIHLLVVQLHILAAGQILGMPLFPVLVEMLPQLAILVQRLLHLVFFLTRL